MYIAGGGIVLLWLGAWLLLHLGNFEVRISQIRHAMENRMGTIERQLQAYNKFFAENERTAQTLFNQLGEVKSELAATKQQLEEVKKSINVLEVAVSDLKLRANPRNVRFG